MALLNRVALIVHPKRRFVDWVNSLGTVKPKLTIEEARTNPNVYLFVSDPIGGARPGAAEFVEAYGEEMYEAELGNWCDDDQWPEDLSTRAFNQHFDVELAELVWDLDEDEPLDDSEDDLTGEDEDQPSEEELEAAGRLMAECAWCGKPVGAMTNVLPVNFEAFQPETLEAEGLVVPFPLPRAGKTLKGVRQTVHAHEHGPWCDHDDDDDSEFAGEGEAGLEEDVAEEDVEPQETVAQAPTIVLNICSEACRAKLVVAVEAEKEGR